MDVGVRELKQRLSELLDPHPGSRPHQEASRSSREVLDDDRGAAHVR
jgi:hypothetical protein